MCISRILPRLLFLPLALFVLYSCSSRKNLSRTVPSSTPASSASGDSYATYSTDVQSYISKYSVFAVEEMKKYGVPASITLAQGIHESRAGKSTLAIQANNHFGIKCTSDWTGPGFHIDDDRPNECFRKYSNPDESFNDHMLFLQRKRYSSLFILDKTDYKGWAYGLKRCGYATNPKYAEILISMIERYDLTRFDGGKMPDLPQQSLASAYKAQQQSTYTGSAGTSGTAQIPSGTSAPQSGSYNSPYHSSGTTDTVRRKVYITDTIYQYTYQKTANAPDSKNTLTKQVRTTSPAPVSDAADSSQSGGTALIMNKPAQSIAANQASTDNQNTDQSQGSKTYKVRQGDTLYGISHRMNVTMDDLRKLNGLTDNTIHIDQVLRLE